MIELTDAQIEALLVNTKAFMNTVYYVSDYFGFPGHHKDIGTCIAFSDLIEMREEFLEALVNTTISFVYAKEKQTNLIEKFKQTGNDEAAAWVKLFQHSKSKFRTANPVGQFSELLIFLFLQHHFKAIPALRKMPITTNTALERNGADAIHLSISSGKPELYLAECKTYPTTSFNSATYDATKDIVKHYNEHRSELTLYVYDDFIAPELEKFCQQYKNGEIKDVKVNLVAMIAYNADFPQGTNQVELQNAMMNDIKSKTASINKQMLKSHIPENLIPRLHYLIFPISSLKMLMDSFKKQLGG